MATYDAEARDRKKKKLEPVISKRGKLIFEDDFSGKELKWTIPPGHGKWKIVKKTLVTKSTGTGANYVGINRPILPVNDVIFELRVLLPMKISFGLGYGKRASASLPSATIIPSEGVFCFGYYDGSGEGLMRLTQDIFLYRKPRWIPIMLETLGNHYAFTVDGKTITYDAPIPEPIRKLALGMGCHKGGSELLAVDDVKVWEALPKDEDNQEGKKKKKKRR